MLDFEYHYPDSFVETAVVFLERSNWVCWPDGIGGWAEQDAFLVDDIKLYMRLRERAEWEAKHGIDESAEIQQTDIPLMRLDNL